MHFAFGAAIATATPSTYYVSPTGNDSANGTSASSAWKSVNRVNQQVFAPGDRILFQGGQTFNGMLWISDRDGANPSAPATFGSYGTGRATLANADQTAIYLDDASGVTITDLNIVGPGAAGAKYDGITAHNDTSGATRRDGVTIKNVTVSGFKSGITIGAAANSAGYQNLTVRDSTFRDNRLAGLLTWGPAFNANAPTYAHQNVQIIAVTARGNTGDSTLSQNSGNGIVLGSVDTGLIEASTASGNGARSSAHEGPAGIWAYDSTRITIQKNLAFGNKTSKADGDGFDLDQNVSNSLMQYNLSYGNDGAGFMLFTNALNKAHTGNTLRYNISVNDGRKGWYGGITVFGGLNGGASQTGVFNADIYQNTVVIPASWSVKPPALRIEGTLGNVRIANNILTVGGGIPTVTASKFTASGLRLLGNDYHSASAPFVLQWNGTTYNTLAKWRTASGQETLSGRIMGTDVNPQLLDRRTPTITSATQLLSATGFKVSPGSAVTGKGIDLSSLQISRGTRDYYGTSLPAGVFDIGAAAATPDNS